MRSVKRLISNYAEIRSACEIAPTSYGERVSDSHTITREDKMCWLADLDSAASKAGLTENEREVYDLTTRGVCDRGDMNLEQWVAKRIGATQQGANFILWTAAKKIFNELTKPLVRNAGK